MTPDEDSDAARDDVYDFLPEPNGDTREEFAAKYPQFDDDALDAMFGDD